MNLPKPEERRPPVRRVLSSVALVALGVLLTLTVQMALKQFRGPELETAAEVGARAPEVSEVDLNGQVVMLSSFRGRPVILNFRTTWCPHCRAEAPVLQEASQADGGLVVLSVYLGEPADTVRAYTQELGLTHPITVDTDGSSGNVYGVSGIPKSYFVDAKGVIIGEHLGPLDQATIQAAFAGGG